MKWVDVQRNQFRRLGVLGDWDRPYLTLDPRYEAGILDVLADLVERGYVNRQLKPIHWCMTDRTALAEAELEYQEETTPSIYVNFPDGLGRARELASEMMPPRPLARHDLDDHALDAAGQRRDRRPSGPDYAGVRYTDPATGQTRPTDPRGRPGREGHGLRQVDRVTEELGRCRGRDLEHSEYRHPFIDRVSPIVLAGYVSVEDGTGLVHTAPGHGAEDYQTGRAYQLSVLSPVDESGRFTAEAPEWLTGQQVFAANPVIVARLEGVGAPVPRAAARRTVIRIAGGARSR